jgi:hypothetical protein
MLMWGWKVLAGSRISLRTADVKVGMEMYWLRTAILDTHNYACFVHLTDGDGLMSSWLASPSVLPA